MKRITQTVALIAVLTFSSLACFGISQEEMQSALDRQAAANQQQADTTGEQHDQAIAGKDLEIKATNTDIAELQESLALAGVEAAGLQDQLNAANKETGTAKEQLTAESTRATDLQVQLSAERTRATGMQVQLSTERSKVSSLQQKLNEVTTGATRADAWLTLERAKNARLQLQLTAATRETNAAKTQRNAQLIKTANARKETRWAWEPAPMDDIRFVTGFTPNLGEDTNAPGALVIACAENIRSILYYWHTTTYEDLEYEIKAGLDDEQLRIETLRGFDGMPSLLFTGIDGSDLWRAKTLTLSAANGTLTFDTTQLRRMFPTEKSFCDGEKPKSN